MVVPHVLRVAFLIAVLVLPCRPAAGTVRFATVDDVVDSTFQFLGEYWWREFFLRDLDYDPMLEIHIYDTPEDWIVEHRCAGIPDYNAIYCRREQAMFLDRQLLEEEFARYGPGAVAVTVGHEYGHHIQNVLFPEAMNDPYYTQDQGFQITIETQADCLSGLALRTLYDDGVLTDADLEDAWHILGDSGDDALGIPRTVWSHGAGEDRQNAFWVGISEESWDDCGLSNAA